MQTINGHKSPVEAVRFSTDEKRLLSGCTAGIIKIWDVEESKSLFSLTVTFLFLQKARTLSLCSLSFQNTFVAYLLHSITC